MTLSIARYEARDAPAWNAFVATARNATFQFDRGYMDYHAARFADASLVVRDAVGRFVALLPAHREGDLLVTHGGLSHGALLVDAASGQRRVLDLFERLLPELAGLGVKRWRYKTVPAHWQRLPSDDDRYALYRLGARWWRCEAASVIAPGTAAPRRAARRAMLRRARRCPGAELRDDACWSEFWPLQTEVLAQRHGVAPVHSLAEITLLAASFPQHIRLATAWLDGAIAAGGVFFESDRVVRAQYLAAGDLARREGLLDRVLDDAIARAAATDRWFDFGNSTEQGGAILNEGLIAYKESFGARTAVHDGFELDLPAP